MKPVMDITVKIITCVLRQKKFKLQRNSNLFVLIMSDHEKNNVL